MSTSATDAITLTPVNRSSALPSGFLPGQPRLVALKTIVKVEHALGHQGARVHIRGALTPVETEESYAAIAAVFALAHILVPGDDR
ncbi:MAG: hypothetical protein ACOZNI_19740 [Myxococcota bacterium]